MARVQLALNVSDVEEAVRFYSQLFGTAPAKRKLGYANFVVEDPPLKLVLIENDRRGGTLNHLGVEVESTDRVKTEAARIQASGLETRSEEEVDCCYAVQNKVWTSDPDGAPWEIYTVLADTEGASKRAGACC